MSDKKTFQIVDIISDDLPDDKNKKSFIITLYGIDKDNHRIVCHITKYLPYFYIKIPNEWDQPTGVKLIKDICNIKPGQDIENTIFESVIRLQLNTCKDFYGVYWNSNTQNIQEFHYLKISMKTHDSMKKIILLVKKHYNLKKYNPESKLGIRLNEWKLNTTTTYDCDCNLYEATIHPIIKFIHDTNINPTGWIQCKYKNDIVTGLFNSCEYEYSASYKSIQSISYNEVSNYKIASFDIECDSSHGDFPLAKKNFKKLAVDMFDSYQSILKNSPESRRETYNEKIEIHLLKLLISGFIGDFSKFNSSYKYANMNKINIINNELPSEDVYNDIISKITDDLSILNTIQNINIKGKERDNCITKIQNIIEEICNQLNIQVEGDPIIQIGTVVYEFGTGNIIRHILVISPNNDEDICDDINGIIVERCKDEKELLLGWKNIINKMDPDFITGYNIFGFDFKYIHERAKILFPCKDRCNDPWWHVNGCPMKEFLNFGKMDCKQFRSKDHKCKKCNMKTQKLSSSALGDNTLNYLTMDGRILFDIQKEVQKGHNLESYKLDNVASHFMRGKLFEVTDNKILVSDIGQLKDGDYVSFRTHTNIGEELFNNGKKYKISQIIKKYIYLTENLMMNLKDYHKVEWCLNKDDISPQDIFDKHKYGGSSGRAEVAKYCIQDCELCINLLLLLDIVPNNLGMAGVSYVPASFIFLRGQGVKVSSVVSRESSKRKTRIPDLQKLPNLKDYIKIYNNKKTISDNDLELRLNKLYRPDDDNDDKINSKQKDSYLKYFKNIECPIEKNTKLEILSDSDWRKPEEYELDEYYKRIVSQAENGIDGYEGAIVLDPIPGIYLEDPISVLDYASLYPSSIIEKNISHETYIENKDLLPLIGEDNYYTIRFQDWIYKGKGKGDTIKKKEKIDTNENQTETICHFLKPEYMIQKNMFQEGDNPIGIIPAVLDHLLSARKKTKKLMKDEKDDFKRKVLDGLQLAYKVTANSVYGQLGAKTSGIFKMNLAACTTSVGRSRIYDASSGVKEWAYKKGYKEPEIVYGDSVLPDTPLILKHKLSDEISIQQIDELSNEYTDYHQFKSDDSNRKDKQQSLINDYEIYTSEGWSPIRRVIRHKTKKLIYRITTHTSVTDVTEDHSLLDERNNLIKPSEVTIGDKLLHNYIDFESHKIHLNDILHSINIIGSKSLSEKKAFIYGFFYGDGSCGKYNTNYGIKYTWALNQHNIETCSILQSLLMEIYNQEFNILDTLKSSGIHKIVPVKYIKKYVNEYRSLFYNKDKYKIIPQSILNGSYEERYSFFCGYYLADGSKCYQSKSKNIILTNKGKIGSSMLYYLSKSLGFEVSINSRKDKTDIFQITCSSQLRKDKNIIKKIEILKEINNEFVYDIETVQGNFNTGFECIVKNTDSVFVKFSRELVDGTILEDKKALDHCIQCGKEAGEYITHGIVKQEDEDGEEIIDKHEPLLNHPQDLEYEKTFWPFILISKKRYTGDKYEFDSKSCKRDAMGIVLKRRDNAPIVKYIFGNVIEKIMIEKDFELAVQWLKENLLKIRNEVFPLRYFIITKALNGYYKNPQQIAHKVLADRMAVRDPGNKPKPNDRIPYAYIKLPDEKLLDYDNPYKSGARKGQPRLNNIMQGDRIEHSDHIIQNKLKIDYEFYISNQIMNPVKQVLDLHMDEKTTEQLFSIQ